jgi:hypothetical protein
MTIEKSTSKAAAAAAAKAGAAASRSAAARAAAAASAYQPVTLFGPDTSESIDVNQLDVKQLEAEFNAAIKAGIILPEYSFADSLEAYKQAVANGFTNSLVDLVKQVQEANE